MPPSAAVARPVGSFTATGSIDVHAGAAFGWMKCLDAPVSGMPSTGSGGLLDSVLVGLVTLFSVNLLANTPHPQAEPGIQKHPVVEPPSML